MAGRRRLVGVGGLKLKIGEETGHEGHGSRCRVPCWLVTGRKS